MKYLSTYKIFEKLNFDVNEIDDILIDLIDEDFMYRVELDWYNGNDEDDERVESVKITIWKKGTNILSSDLEFVRENINRLINFMKQGGYSVISTYPNRLMIGLSSARSGFGMDKVDIVFGNGRRRR